jgi:hypothetical protein
VTFQITTPTNNADAKVKIAFNKLAVAANSISGSGCIARGSHQVLCGSGSYNVTASVQGGTVANAVEISAIVSSFDGRDCAVAFDSITINNGRSLCENEIVSDGVFCFDSTKNCFRRFNCPPPPKKRALKTFDIFPMTYSVSYRRVVSRSSSSSESDSSDIEKQVGKKLVNSRESACGPRFTFRINREIQFLSTQGGDFLSQGFLSFAANATIPADGSQFKVSFETVAINCKESKLIAFDEHPRIGADPIDAKQLEEDRSDKFASESSSEVF